MTHIKTIPPDEADGPLAEIYENDLKTYGYIPNYHQAMSLRPAMIGAWSAFQGEIRKHMRLRRWELVTLASTCAMHCRY